MSFFSVTDTNVCRCYKLRLKCNKKDVFMLLILLLKYIRSTVDVCETTLKRCCLYSSVALTVRV